MSSLGLRVFHTLCDAGKTLDAMREGTAPGSDTWCAFTELAQALDTLIERLVESPPLEEEPCPVDAPRA